MQASEGLVFDGMGKQIKKLRLISRFSVVFPWIFLFVLINLFHVDMPQVEQWGLISAIGKTIEGEISFNHLFLIHNGHYITIPKLIILTLAYISGWNILYEVIFGFFVASLSFLILYKSASRLKSIRNGDKFLYLVPILSWTFFSLNQWQNWYLGFQICIFLNVFFVISGFYFLTRISHRRLFVLAAAVAGIAATLSFGNGLLFWIIALVLIILRPAEKNHKRNSLIFWILVSSGVFYYYISDLNSSASENGTLMGILRDPVSYFGYVFIYLGAPLVSYAWGLPFGYSIAFFIGMIGTIFFFGFCFKSYVGSRYELNNIMVFQAIGLYAIGSACLTGLARMDYGYMQALSSRYITFSLLLWIANIVFIFEHLKVDQGVLRLIHFFDRKSKNLFVTIIFTMVLSSYLYGSIMAYKKNHDFQSIRDSILFPTDSEEVKRLRKIYGPYDEQSIQMLKKYRLSLFRTPKP